MASVGSYNAEREYKVLAYDTTTGRVIRELPLTDEPTWDLRLNEEGGGGVSCPLGVSDDWDQWLREVARPYRYSLAVGLADTGTDTALLQAGPLTGYVPDEEPSPGSAAKIGYSFKGLWELLNRRLAHRLEWDPAVTPITDVTADLTLNGSLHDIAVTLVYHATNMASRAGSGLPIDIPALDALGGDNTRTYHGFDMIPAGQRLQELTQVDHGPDVLFRPYLTTFGGYRQVRHTMITGSPYIVQPGVPLRFDYRSNLTKVAVNGVGDNTSTAAFVKGTGNENAQQYGYATDNAVLTNQGWPLLDYVDSNHTSALIQSTLDGWARADVAVLGNLPEQWKATVLTETEPRLGTYVPGHFMSYNILDHHWIPDGLYTWRLLGLARTSSTQRGAVEQSLLALGAY